MRTEFEVAGWAHPTPETWILRFVWEHNPLPMNGSRGVHWAGRARTVKHVRNRSRYLAELARIPLLGRCEAQLTWWITKTRTRDTDNLAGLEKPLFDGLVDAHVVADDSPAFMTKPRGVIRHVHDSEGLVTEPCFTLTITRLDLEDEWEA